LGLSKTGKNPKKALYRRWYRGVLRQSFLLLTGAAEGNKGQHGNGSIVLIQQKCTIRQKYDFFPMLTEGESYEVGDTMVVGVVWPPAVDSRLAPSATAFGGFKIQNSKFKSRPRRNSRFKFQQGFSLWL
jgi:hypothetical protein